MERICTSDRAGSQAAGLQGLGAQEASQQRQRFGRNDVVDASPHPWLTLLRETAKDPMLWFLVLAGGLYALLGQMSESITLFVSILPLVAMDAVLHRRTQASTEGLQSRMAESARVERDGAVVEVAAHELVPGDLVLVADGEFFPADGVVVKGEGLQIDESALTGEAYPVVRSPLEDLKKLGRPEFAVPDDHLGLAGTRLLTGEAQLRVVWTGDSTLYGEIVRLAQLGRFERTPLQLAIGRLVRVLVIAAVVLCAVLAVAELLRGAGWVDALVSAVTLAIAAIPEEFPVVFTMFLAVGVYRLAHRKALVRRAVSVENIGRISCICSDKTGTLTRGELQLTHWLPVDEAHPEGLQSAAALAARVESGDPLDVAIFEALRTVAENGNQASPPQEPRVLAAFPFTEDRRRETTVAVSEGMVHIAVKGAPETILGLCSQGGDERIAWAKRADNLAAEGHKVIACAAQSFPGSEWSGQEPSTGFDFVGLLGLEDPVREGAAEAVRRCQKAGIRVLMITGDHPDTAAAIARELGLGSPQGADAKADGHAPRVVVGQELADAGEEGLDGLIAKADVVARALPSQKLAIVRALQRQGEIVAVTGDGVNDVPALQAADVGIAMGERGTRSAREVAAIVLLDDNFRTIVHAIAEGRQLFRNLQRSFQYLLMVHAGLVLSATLIPLAGYPTLFLPIHIVWLELLIHPSAMLAFQDSSADGQLAGGVDRSRATFFSTREWGLIVFVGALLVVGVFLSYRAALGAELDVERARAMAMLVMSLASAGLVAGLTRLRTAAARWIVVGSVSLAALLIQLPWLAGRLHVEPLGPMDWALALLTVAVACAPISRLGGTTDA
ncbi:Calcium-transporting ATPase 1 [Planctomycetes bacterium Poly30]|uniref:P-type Cu(+) transporter n=1 Tax=Saltatorellus ferox TaxID=2528018 RepID=A0A518EXL2_9BACT|nr:Calcium-transporting ATPase 1 [Planctomycetes bacterium Poly30]